MFVCCEYCVLSGRGLCDELITSPEESYRLCCVVVCNLENLKNEDYYFTKWFRNTALLFCCMLSSDWTVFLITQLKKGRTKAAGNQGPVSSAERSLQFIYRNCRRWLTFRTWCHHHRHHQLQQQQQPHHSVVG